MFRKESFLLKMLTAILALPSVAFAGPKSSPAPKEKQKAVKSAAVRSNADRVVAQKTRTVRAVAARTGDNVGF